MHLSKTDERCLKCKYFEDCDNKRMVACAVMNIPEPIAQTAGAKTSQALQSGMLVKHDYREIKIAENTTVTIDLEELKKKMEEDFYKQLNCSFMQFGG